jgi:hypothetical protein
LYQNDGFSVLSSIGETEKSKVDGEHSHVVLVKKFPGEKGSVKRCVVVTQQPVLQAKPSHILTQSP